MALRNVPTGINRAVNDYGYSFPFSRLENTRETDMQLEANVEN